MLAACLECCSKPATRLKKRKQWVAVPEVGAHRAGEKSQKRASLIAPRLLTGSKETANARQIASSLLERIEMTPGTGVSILMAATFWGHR